MGAQWYCVSEGSAPGCCPFIGSLTLFEFLKLHSAGHIFAPHIIGVRLGTARHPQLSFHHNFTSLPSLPFPYLCLPSCSSWVR